MDMLCEENKISIQDFSDRYIKNPNELDELLDHII